MSNAGDYSPIPPETFGPLQRPPGAGDGDYPAVFPDPCLSLLNLSTVRSRMDSLQQFLSDSVNSNTLIGQQQMQMVSSEIASAIHQIILNGAALLAASQSPNFPSRSREIEQNPPEMSNPISIRESVGLNLATMTNLLSSGVERGAVDLKEKEIGEEKKDGFEDDEIEQNPTGISNLTSIQRSVGFDFSNFGGKSVKIQIPMKLTNSTCTGVEKRVVDLEDIEEEMKDGIENDEMQHNPSGISNPILIQRSVGLNSSNFEDESVKIQIPVKLTNSSSIDLKLEAIENGEWEIIELDAVELLAEHVHFCEICGKGFKRDANLRMHMRAHGNQFKTPEALAKPANSGPTASISRRRTRFSCPFAGCNRNKLHKKFRPLKSVICVKNHFKRSHCPKMYSCNRCNKKSFSVVADLKSHLKHCGESKWKCSCGTSFSRKDKLFGHMALFEGHMPAVMEEEDEKGKGTDNVVVKDMELNCSDNLVFDELLEGFGSIENYCLQEILDSGNGVGTGISDFLSF